MKPLDDRELTTLLRKWEAPPAPATLRIPPGRGRASALQQMLQWLMRGSIRVPVPVGIAIAVVVAFAGIQFSHRTEVPVLNLPKAGTIFSGPVPVTAPAVENTIPTPAQDYSNTASAAEAKVSHPSPELAGFRPVRNIEPRIVGAMR